MNKINPEKLMLSKWTAIKPKQKERHFIVTKLVRDENEIIISCELEAVINRHIYQMDWQELKDCTCWQIGWK